MDHYRRTGEAAGSWSDGASEIGLGISGGVGTEARWFHTILFRFQEGQHCHCEELLSLVRNGRLY